MSKKIPLRYALVRDMLGNEWGSCEELGSGTPLNHFQFEDDPTFTEELESCGLHLVGRNSLRPRHSRQQAINEEISAFREAVWRWPFLPASVWFAIVDHICELYSTSKQCNAAIKRRCNAILQDWAAHNDRRTHSPQEYEERRMRELHVQSAKDNMLGQITATVRWAKEAGVLTRTSFKIELQGLCADAKRFGDACECEITDAIEDGMVVPQNN